MSIQSQLDILDRNYDRGLITEQERDEAINRLITDQGSKREPLGKYMSEATEAKWADWESRQ